jgi:hypothetical protein
LLDRSFLNFVENTVVHERNLLEKLATYRGRGERQLEARGLRVEAKGRLRLRLRLRVGNRE